MKNNHCSLLLILKIISIMKTILYKPRIILIIALFSFFQLQAQSQDNKEDPLKRGLSKEQLDSLRHKSAASDVTNYNGQDHMGTPRQDLVDKGWIGLKGLNSEIKLWGWVQAAVIGDFQGNYFNNVQEFSSGVIPVPTVNSGTSGFDAGSSRLFFQTRHLLKTGHAVQTVFIMDAGGGAAPGWAVPRIRQFYVTINNLTFGATNGTFANFNTWPGYFDRGAPGAFPLARKPVIKYALALDKKKRDFSVLTFGVEWANPAFSNANAIIKIPDIVVRYDYSPKWGNLMLGVIARDLIATSTDDTQPGVDEQWVWAAQFSGLWTFGKKKDHLRWVVMYGPAISGYMWDTGFEPGNTGVYDPNVSTLYTMDAWGGFVSYEHNWSKKLYSMFMVAYADINNISQQPTSAFNNSSTYTVTLRYSPWDDFFVAGEYFYGQRVNYDDQMGYDSRINIVLRYMFNH